MMALQVHCIDSKGTIFHHDSHPSMVFASFDGDNFEVLNS
jgi:L-asparaginase